MLAADDLSRLEAGSVSTVGTGRASDGLQLENEHLRVRLLPGLGLEVLDKRAGHVWRQPRAEAPWVVLSSDVLESVATLRLRGVPSGMPLTAKLTLEGPEITVELEAPPDARLEGEVCFPGPLLSRPEDHAIVPYAQGMILPVDELDLQRDLWYSGYKTTMGWSGITDLRSGYMILPTTPADAGLRIRPTSADDSELLSLHMVWVGQKGKWGYPRRVTYRFFDEGGYVAMAQRYRRWAEDRGYVKPLREKLRDRPHLDRLIGAVDFWGRSGTNDAAFYRELRSLGIDRAICSLGGGWIPPKGVSELVAELNEAGYLPSHYDIYTDVWPGSEDDQPRWARKHGYPEDVYVNPDGSLRKGWVIRSKNGDFQGYYICATQHEKGAIPRISADLEESPYTCRFIDVVTAMGLAECYSTDHPVTRSEDIAAKREMLGLVSERFGLVTGSEEARDWALAVSDYAEGTMTIKAAENAGYDWMRPVDADEEYLKLNADGRYRLPLHALAFHDCHVATWYTGDGATKVPEAWPKKDLLNILYGTMPLWMPDAELWQRYREEFVASYFRVCPVFRATGYDQLVSHEFLTADRRVQRTRFSGGTTVTVNFGPEPHDLEPSCSPTAAGLRLPDLGYAVTGPSVASYRAEFDGRTVEYVETGDRAYLASPDGVHDGGAIAMHGTVALVHAAEGPFILVLKAQGPIGLREDGPLAGRALARARVVAEEADGHAVAVQSAAGERHLVFQAISGIERYEIRYGRPKRSTGAREADQAGGHR